MQALTLTDLTSIRVLELEPLPSTLRQRSLERPPTLGAGEKGSGFVFEEKLRGMVIPRQYVPAVEAGIRDALEEAVEWARGDRTLTCRDVEMPDAPKPRGTD